MDNRNSRAKLEVFRRHHVMQDPINLKDTSGLEPDRCGATASAVSFVRNQIAQKIRDRQRQAKRGQQGKVQCDRIDDKLDGLSTRLLEAEKELLECVQGTLMDNPSMPSAPSWEDI